MLHTSRPSRQTDRIRDFNGNKPVKCRNWSGITPYESVLLEDTRANLILNRIRVYRKKKRKKKVAWRRVSVILHYTNKPRRDLNLIQSYSVIICHIIFPVAQTNDRPILFNKQPLNICVTVAIEFRTNRYRLNPHALC